MRPVWSPVSSLYKLVRSTADFDPFLAAYKHYAAARGGNSAKGRLSQAGHAQTSTTASIYSLAIRIADERAVEVLKNVIK